MFEQIDDLEDFKADLPSGSAECNSEQWQTTHGARVCVANDTSSGQPSSGANPLTFVLLAGVLVVILLLCVLAWQWMVYRKDRPSETHSLASSQESALFDV
ncbi:hypothetical protein PC129_g3037 [Phytophthora cactorum]|nr:hypothetical protein PC129_g3037 [Phytophthora cactorum]